MELTLVPQTIIACSHCEVRQTTAEDAVNGLCTRCVTLRGIRECGSCLAEFVPGFAPTDDNPDALDDYPLCEDCTIVCPSCEERIVDTFTVRDWDQNRQRYDEQEVCKACRVAEYTRCSDCSAYVDNDSITDVHGDSICVLCLEGYSACAECELYFHRDNLRCDIDGDGEYCEDCYREEEEEEEEEQSSSVHSYNYSPSTMFFDAYGKREFYSNGVFHGIELEAGWKVGDSDDYAQAVIKALGEICYLKEDSTITSGTGLYGGFEIVTHPCDLEHYRTALKSICNGKIPGLLSHNTDNAGCGLHISVNRSCLTNHAIARICAFIGADRNEAWIVKMARRKSDRWAEIKKKTCIEDTLQVCDGHEYLIRNADRYEAVNLLNPSHVEFRLFRGTLKYSSAMLCLEFVNALCRWCMEPADVSEYQSAQSLLAFARNELEVYPHLIAFLCANI